MREVLIVKGEQCTGCRICELICSLEKHGECNPRKSYIQVLKNREMDVNMITFDQRCDFCNKCVEWCPRDVLKFLTWEEAAIIRKEEKGLVYPAPLIKGT